MELFAAVRPIIASDRGGRKVSSLLLPGHIQEGLSLLEAASSVAVVTGFFVPACGAPETDGPGGAVVLARALERCGRRVELFTDSFCFSVLDACADSLGGPKVRAADSGEGILSTSPSLIVFLERLGRAADRRYYNMRGEDISSVTSPLDDAAARALEAGIPVLAIGDGGNEAGMGNFRTQLAELLPEYATCLSVTEASVTMCVDVSDWGGYALAGLLSITHGEWVGADEDELSPMLAAQIAAGAVDGVTRRGEPTVDGFDIDVHRSIVRALKDTVRSSMRE